MRLLLISLCVFLAACVPVVETVDGRRLRATDIEFREYAQSVLQRSNALVIALAEASDRTDSAAIFAAEDRLLSDCAPLNHIAAARRDKRETGTAELRAAARSVPTCERAAYAAEQILQNSVDLPEVR